MKSVFNTFVMIMAIVSITASSAWTSPWHDNDDTDNQNIVAGMGMGNMGMPQGQHHWMNVHHYDVLNVEMSDDVFVNPDRFQEITGGMNFIDAEGDGICDYFQDTEAFESLHAGMFTDENGDTIHDPFQSQEMYRLMGMSNFFDADGDGYCDNYEGGWHMSRQAYADYNGSEVDMSEDFYINPGQFRYITGGMNFIDTDGDGICDYFQDGVAFDSLGVGEFVDENGDSIHDPFQNQEMYQLVGMTNFNDIDGDGICDNYGMNWSRSITAGMNYEDLEVDLSGDIYQNENRFHQITGGMGFVDADEDGVCDYFQNTQAFSSLNMGNFADANGDGIHDPFQNRSFYEMIGMGNFVDSDGDGLCDNYLQ